MAFPPTLERFLSTLSFGFAAAFLAHCGEDEPSCDDLIDEAASRRNEIETAPENSSCTTDTDCVTAYHRLRCVEDCGQPTAILPSAVERVAAAVAAVERDVCGPFDEQRCVSIEYPCGAGPETSLARAVCRRGQCGIDYPPEY